jgi:cyanophycinase-like exopeptidase
MVGAQAFLPSMAEFDLGLLRATGRRRPRVAIVPTAAFGDGETQFQREMALGVQHFRDLGAEVEAVEVRDRSGAEDPANAQAVGEADLIYFCGRASHHLVEALAGTAAWAAAAAAHERGSILAGSGAGAMALGERQLNVGPRLGWPVHWEPALKAASGLAILPSYDARPEPLMALLAMGAPRDMSVIGIDREAAMVGRDGVWQVHGPARVTVWRGRHRERHRSGEAFRICDPTE